MKKETRNSKVLRSFVKYAEEHPTERFWQALRNWAGALKIYFEYENQAVDDEICEDTFYWTGRYENKP